jgi:hypothetical protein
MESPIHILLDKILWKVVGVWGRVFFQQMKLFNRDKIREKGNLAFAVAGKMPANIRDEVGKIVRYYEVHMEDQLHRIHKLVE